MVKALLESHGISVFLKDELTVQVDSYVSNAIGGVKVQVNNSDAKTSVRILKEAGYIKEEHKKQTNSNSIFSDLTSRLPVIGNLVFELRILIIIGFSVILFSIIGVLLSIPSKTEQITAETWYLNKVKYNDKYYQPNTLGLKLVLNNGDSEYIKFYNDGSVIMPGFNTNGIRGKWKLDRDKLTIFDSDTLGYLYNGDYEVIVNSNSISLTSESTRIVGRINRVSLF